MGSTTFTPIAGTSIQTPTADTGNLQRVAQQLKEAIEIGQRLRGSVGDSFVRVSELQSAFGARVVNNTIQPPSSTSYLSTVVTTDSISGSGATSSPIQLVGDAASPGNNMVYGTNGSGTRGWYSASGAVSPISITDGTHTVTNAATVTFSGAATVSGTSPNAVVTVAGTTGAAGPQGPAIFLDADPYQGEDGFPIPGPQGPPGTGAPGPQGASGVATYLEAEPGLDGDMGPPGPPGPAGVGTTGAQGPTGLSMFVEDGMTGEDGMPGVGPPGPTGAAGVNGINGVTMMVEDGAEGEMGMPIPGQQGIQGITGAQGPAGSGAGITIEDPPYYDDLYCVGPYAPVMAPELFGPVIITPPSSGVALTVTGLTNGSALLVQSAGTTSVQQYINNTAAGCQAALGFQIAGSVNGLVGVAGLATNLVNDSAQGDLVLRTQGGNFRVTTNSGTSTALEVNANGALSVGGNNASATSGDITAARTATTGVLYLGTNALHYLYFDGGTYNFGGGAPVTTAGGLITAGGITVATNNWNVDSGGQKRFYWGSTGDSYFEIGGGSFHWRNSSDVDMMTLSNAGVAQFNASSAGTTTLTVKGVATSTGFNVQAGASGSDYCAIFANAANTAQYFTIYGDGGVVVGAPTGGDKGAGTINATGLYVNGVSQSITTGTFSASLVGFTGTVTSTVRYVLAGNLVTLTFGTATGTSNSAGMSCAASTLPSAIRPSVQCIMPCVTENNGVNAASVVRVVSDGSINFGVGASPGSGYTASGTKGFGEPASVSYTTN